MSRASRLVQTVDQIDEVNLVGLVTGTKQIAKDVSGAVSNLKLVQGKLRSTVKAEFLATLHPDDYFQRFKRCPQYFEKDNSGKCMPLALFKIEKSKQVKARDDMERRLHPDDYYTRLRKCPKGYDSKGRRCIPSESQRSEEADAAKFYGGYGKRYPSTDRNFFNEPNDTAHHTDDDYFNSYLADTSVQDKLNNNPETADPDLGVVIPNHAMRKPGVISQFKANIPEPRAELGDTEDSRLLNAGGYNKSRSAPKPPPRIRVSGNDPINPELSAIEYPGYTPPKVSDRSKPPSSEFGKFWNSMTKEEQDNWLKTKKVTTQVDRLGNVIQHFESRSSKVLALLRANLHLL